MTRNKPWLRAISLLTCVFFATTDILKAELSVAMLAPSANAVVESATPVTEVEIPASLGELARAYQGKSKQIVVIVQDAHANYEAQKNIAGILSHLADKNGLRTVNVEGAEGYLYHSFLSAYPNAEARRAMAEYFMKEAKLTGPEYAAIVERPDMKLFGVEEETLYQENRKVFLEALDYKGLDEVILAGIRKLLESIGKKIFSKDLYELIKRGEDFRRESKNIMAFIDFLTQFAGQFGVDLTAYAQISQFLTLNQIHGGMIETEAEKEAALLAKALKNLSVPKNVSEKAKDKFTSLVLEAVKQGLDLTPYPQARLVSQSFEIQKKIDVRLFDEVEKLNKELRAKLLKTEEEKALEHLFKILEIYEKIFDFSLTRDDADFFFANRQEFQMANFKSVFARFQDLLEWNGGFPEEAGRIDGDLARIEKFYELALKRDKVLVDKTLSELKTDEEPVIALVAGGFHTAGFQRILEEKEISHITVRPTITELKDPQEQNRLYEQSVRQEPEAFAQLLVRNRQKGQRLNDPRYQLSAHKLLFSMEEVSEVLKKAGKEGLSANLETLILDNPQAGANVTLALVTVLMDIKYLREAFSVKARLDSLLAISKDMESLLPAEEDREFRRAVYSTLLSDKTEVYQLRGAQKGLKVFGANDVVVTMEPVRRRTGFSPREYGTAVADELRRGAGTAVVDDSRFVIKTALGIDRQLEILKAGRVLVKPAPVTPIAPRVEVEALPMAASMGSEETVNALKEELIPVIQQISANLAISQPDFEAAASQVADLKKRLTNGKRRVDNAMKREELGETSRRRLKNNLELNNFRTDLRLLELKLGFLVSRNQLLTTDETVDETHWRELDRKISRLASEHRAFFADAEAGPTHVQKQRPRKDTPEWQERNRRLQAFRELEETFPAKYLTQLRHYVALLRALQQTQADFLGGVSELPQEWMSGDMDKRFGKALKAVRDADFWTESVEDGSAAVRAFVKSTRNERITPAEALVNFAADFQGAVELVNQARAVVSQDTPDEASLISADKQLKEAKERLSQLLAFDRSVFPADRTAIIVKALQALEQDRTAVRELYNEQAQKILDAREAEQREREDAVARKKQVALARGRRLEEMRTFVKGEFPVDAKGIAAQLAETENLLAELDEIRSQTPQPASPESVEDVPVSLNEVAELPEAALPTGNLQDIQAGEVREAIQEAAEHKETRKVFKGAVWKVIAKVAGKLLGWSIKAKKQPLSKSNQEAVRIASTELPTTRQPAQPVNDFLTGEPLPQMGNAQILVQQSSAGNILELLQKISANTGATTDARQKASESLIRQWVLRQTLEWPMAVDLDAKLENTGIFLRSDGKAYHIRNFDHDELVGVNSTGQLTQEQFRKFFYYFWFVQANDLRALDAQNGTKLEAVFHDAVKQSGIFKTLYDNPANVDLLRDAFGEAFARLQARQAALKKLRQDLKAIKSEFEKKKRALADLKAASRKPGAPALGDQIDAAEQELEQLKAGYDTLAAQKK